jgi:hypothetical protein
LAHDAHISKLNQTHSGESLSHDQDLFKTMIMMMAMSSVPISSIGCHFTNCFERELDQKKITRLHFIAVLELFVPAHNPTKARPQI